jgi:LAGLIDADG endonuclease
LLYEFKDLTDVKALPTKLTELNWHITGFVEGDGSFPIVLSPAPDKKFGWLIQPRFEIELRNNTDSLTTLRIVQRVMGLNSTIDSLESSFKLNVTNRRVSLEKVIPFFGRYKPALKKGEFALFKEVTESLESKKHLEEDGFKQIITDIFSLPVNREQRRKWTFGDIFPNEPAPSRLTVPELIFPEGVALRHYLAGFIDAEGALGFAIVPETKTLTPYLTLTHSEIRILRKAQQILQAGNISTGRLQIYGVDAISRKVMPFLEKHQLITKRTAYLEFKKILGLVEEGEHKKRFDEIVRMVRSMNDRGLLRDHTLGAHPEIESEDMAQHRSSVA